MLTSTPASAGTARFNPNKQGRTLEWTRLEASLRWSDLVRGTLGNDQTIRGTKPSTGLDYFVRADLNPPVGGVQLSLFNKDIGFRLDFDSSERRFTYTLSDYDGDAVSVLSLRDESDFNLVRFAFRSMGENGGTNSVSYSHLAFTAPGVTISNPTKLVTSRTNLYQQQFAQHVLGTGGTLLSDYDWSVTGFASATGTNSTKDPKVYIQTGNLGPAAFAPAMATAVPEPQSLALMLAGLAAVGAIARRRQAA